MKLQIAAVADSMDYPGALWIGTKQIGNCFMAPSAYKIMHSLRQAFFTVFEKTQGPKNLTAQKTQQYFRPKLNQPVAIVVT